MDIQLAAERLFLLDERMTAERAEQLATERRAQAFGSGLGSLLQRPKADDIKLIASQRRVEPMWHVAAHATYVYERRREYTVPGQRPGGLRGHDRGHAATSSIEPRHRHARSR